MVLRPETMSPEERAGWLDQAVKRETDSGAGSLTAAAGALEDENRELQATRARIADKKRRGEQPTAEDQADLDRLAGQTDAALTAFVGYRDQFEAVMQSLVEVAAGLLATVATGGAGVEAVGMALARAAAAGAMARVVSSKIVLGDRFDVLGAQGAEAFIAGAARRRHQRRGRLDRGQDRHLGAGPRRRPPVRPVRSAREVPAASGRRERRWPRAHSPVEPPPPSMPPSRTAPGPTGSTRACAPSSTTMAQNALMGTLPPGAAEAFAGFTTLDEFNAAVDALPPNLGVVRDVHDRPTRRTRAAGPQREPYRSSGTPGGRRTRPGSPARRTRVAWAAVTCRR